MFHKILVAIDESESAKAAVDLAVRFAKEDGAELVLVNVVDVAKLVAVAGYETPYPIDAVEMMREAGQMALAKAKFACEAQGLTVTTSLGEGDACDEILRLAQVEGVELICMGTHGRGGLARLFVGSVAEGVLRRAEVPVLVTRPVLATAGQAKGSGVASTAKPG
jgi:nucleotide-binding universal stress UspA family protein